MRGEIEIIVGDKTVYKDSNMVVDSAGSLLADIMTAPRAYADIASLSSILDTSNYTIQAISFGKGKDGYSENAHKIVLEKTQKLLNKIDVNIVSIKEESDVNDSITSSILWGTSSFPEAPSPSLSKLNPYNNFPTEDFVFDPTGTLSSVINTFNNFTDIGQNLNLIPSSINRNIPSIIDFVNNSKINNGLSVSAYYSGFLGPLYTLIGTTYGCWPEGQSQGGTPFYVFSSIEDNNFSITDIVLQNGLDFSSGVYDASSGYFAQSGTLYGYFNEASSMDYSGYVNMIMSSVPNGSYSVSDSSGGLTLSASPDFSSTGMIEYECTMASGDAVAGQLYGGIYNMGLWAMDINSALKAGYTPPLSFDVINNQKRYKLFCRKDLTTSLTQYQDTYGLAGIYTGIHYPATKPAAEKVTIKWRIYFL